MARSKNSSYWQAMLNTISNVVPTFWNIFVVMASGNTSNNNYQHLQDIFTPDSDGRVRFFTSLKDAYDACESNNNDVILLDANSTHTLTAMLTVSKNRVHFIGMDWCGRQFWQGTKVSMWVTAVATDIATIKNTGVRNSFVNLKIMNANTVAQALYTFVEWGEYTYFKNCDFDKETLLDQTTASAFVCNGDSPQFFNCTFGMLTLQDTGDIIRAPFRITKEIAGTGKVLRDAYLENCLFFKFAGGTTACHIYSAADADLERMLLLKNCMFVAHKLGSLPAQAIKGAATFTQWQVLVVNPAFANCTKLSTTTWVFAVGSAATAATAGLNVQAA